MSENVIEEWAENLKVWSTAITEQTSRHTDILGDLINQQIMIIELICRLHDINADEFKDKIRRLEP